ncbi:DUF1289 domain-containing protein [Thauera phenolivorans]|uniref:DUF1289 domain-containing protein n=1 Tax=Thauera phenolivorans TaxID=1792543 RepID=UPI0009F2C7BD|nr:DUF1289 domain-containing protein [Thauera phenolivorans]
MSVPSPCINVCRMNSDTGWCEGCLRSIDEIVRWSRSDDGEKRRILAEVEARRAGAGVAGRNPEGVRA